VALFTSWRGLSGRAVPVRGLSGRAISVRGLVGRALRLGGLSGRARCVLGGAALMLVVAAIWIRCAPVPADLLGGVAEPSTVILDRHGQVLYEPLGDGGSRTRPIDPDRLPPVLASATLAAEDRRFYSHTGVDPIALVRAARQDLVEGQIVEGGSTITQ